MKSKFLLLSLIAVPLIAASCNSTPTADTTTTVENQTPTEDQAMKAKEEQAMMKGESYTGVVLQDGVVFGINSKKELEKITSDTILSDGTHISAAGVITDKDGKVITLKNNEELTNTGAMMMVEPSSFMKHEETTK